LERGQLLHRIAIHVAVYTLVRICYLAALGFLCELPEAERFGRIVAFTEAR
jgi:hypothetical protein